MTASRTRPRILLGRVRDLVDDDGPGEHDVRVLTDRLWPRGVRKDSPWTSGRRGIIVAIALVALVRQVL